MSGRLAICISVDGLRASALGAYGNSAAATPAADALAAESIVFDRMWTCGVQREDFFRSAWNQGQSNSPPLATYMSLPGVATLLITDDEIVAAAAEQGGFADVRLLDNDAPTVADDIAETGVARLYGFAADALSDLGDDSQAQWIWIHSRGLHGPWDAPTSLRQVRLDEADPPPATWLAPPACEIGSTEDQLLVLRTAYAAQVQAWDECLGALLAAIDDAGLAQRALVVLIGCRGFALGEHGAAGSAVQSLYEEVLHVPCLIRSAETIADPHRVDDLVEMSDLREWISHGFEQLSRSGPGNPESELRLGAARRHLIASHPDSGERALLTDEWMLRVSQLSSDSQGPVSPRIELYAKPDDRWEANDVASRCPQVVEELLAMLASDLRPSSD